MGGGSMAKAVNSIAEKPCKNASEQVRGAMFTTVGSMIFVRSIQYVRPASKVRKVNMLRVSFLSSSAVTKFLLDEISAKSGRTFQIFPFFTLIQGVSISAPFPDTFIRSLFLPPSFVVRVDSHVSSWCPTESLFSLLLREISHKDYIFMSQKYHLIIYYNHSLTHDGRFVVHYVPVFGSIFRGSILPAQGGKESR